MKGNYLSNHITPEEEMASGIDAIHYPDPKENVEAMKKTISESGNSEPRPIGLRGYLVGLLVVWTVFVGTVLLWSLLHQGYETLKTARHQARAAFEKDLVYRRWVASHGGVYVPASEQTPPNPYLSHVEERDITTPSGRHLTLMNPAYMTRQVHELGAEQYGLRGHITSLNPIRPENAADLWEKETLESFGQGVTEVSSVEQTDGQSYMRLMRPLVTEEGCLKCHAGQGYKLGDIRGGISVSVPMEPLRAIGRNHTVALTLGYVLLWLLGLSGIGIGAYHFARRFREHKQMVKQQKLTNQVLEMLNQPGEKDHTIRDILLLIKEYAGFEAVGIRLREGRDFPYYETKGFPEDFVEEERYLCALDQAGELIRDSQGNPCLECMCGNIISGRTDPSLPFFTEGGSFWINSTTELLASTSEQDRQARTRNRCNSAGYESVALIPLRSGSEIIGLR